MLVCEERELDYWETREKQIQKFLEETNGIALPTDIDRDLKRKLKDEIAVCIEQENQILSPDMMN